MASVNPPSSGNNADYYQKLVSELEDDYEQDVDRLKRENKKEVSRSETQRAKQQERAEKTIEQTVNEVRDNYQDTLTRERKNAREEVGNLKKQIYDKNGRYTNTEADALRAQNDSLKRGADGREEQLKQNLENAEKMRAEQADRLNQARADDIEETARSTKAAAQASYEKTAEGQKESFREYRDEAEEKYQNLAKRMAEDLDTERKMAKKGIGDVQEDSNRRIKKMQGTETAQLERQSKSYEEKLAQNAYNEGKSRTAEGKALRDSLKTMLAADKEFGKGRAEGRQMSIQEYEDEFRAREQSANDIYKRLLQNEKKKYDELEDNLADLNNRTLREKDLFFSDQLRRQSGENTKAQRELKDSFNRNQAQLEKRNQHDRETSEAYLNSRMTQAQETQDRLLNNQKSSFQNTLSNTRLANETQIKQLKEDLNRRATSSDVNVVSPAAEQEIQKAVIAGYDKKLKAETERNRLSSESMQRSFSKRVEDTVLSAQRKDAANQMRTAVERHMERGELLNHITETEGRTEDKLRTQDVSFGREKEGMQRNFASALDKQRWHYEELLESLKNDNAMRLQQFQQESDFETKMTRRNFNASQNELIRNYEKRITEQKAQLDTVIAQTKFAADKELRDSEKRSKIEREELQRSHQQRLAQLEFQHKERERYLTQNFEDQIEKMKNSNALLAQKKS